VTLPDEFLDRAESDVAERPSYQDLHIAPRSLTTALQEWAKYAS
jgi:hypothetical protein